MKETGTKNYLFDFDGTLVNSMPTFVSVMLRILDEYGIPYDDDLVKTITPLGYHGTAEYFCGLGVPLPTEELVELMNCYAYDAYAYDVLTKESVLETLYALKERGDSLNILTASPHRMLDPCLKRLGIWELFDHVWSCDDFRTTKSDFNIYRLAAQQMGSDVENIIFVDDNVNAVRTARQGGMISYGIYDESSSEYVDEMREVSHRYLERFSDLLTD